MFCYQNHKHKYMYIYTVKICKHSCLYHRDMCKSLGNMASVMRLSCILLLLLGVSGVEVECPPWFYLEHSNSSTFSQCVCSNAVDFAITCRQSEHTAFLKIGHCVLQDVEINQTVVAVCSYVFPTHLIRTRQFLYYIETVYYKTLYYNIHYNSSRANICKYNIRS